MQITNRSLTGLDSLTKSLILALALIAIAGCATERSAANADPHTPFYPIIQINGAVAKSGKGDFDGAISDLTEVIRRLIESSALYAGDPSAPIIPKSDVTNQDALDTIAAFEVYAYFNRGIAERAKGGINQAIDDFNKANDLMASALRSPKAGDLRIALLPINENLYAAYNDRGISEGKRRNFDAAIADFSKAIDLKLELAPAYLNRAKARSAKGDLDGAKVDENRAAELKANSHQ